MARKKLTILQRERARRVRRSKLRRRREKQELVLYLAAVNREAEQFLEDLAKEDQAQQARQPELAATYRKRQLVGEFGSEKGEEIDWGERALESYCKATLSRGM